MRTLHADLTTAQQAASRTPYVRVNFRHRSRSPTRTYTTADATNRIVMVEQAEGRWNGHIEVAGSNLPISAIIRLKDSDQAINVLDHVGYRVDIGWGFNTSSGDRYSEGPPAFVVEQRSFSVEGDLFVEFYCMSLWDMLRLAWSKQTITSAIKYDKDVTVLNILMELLGGITFKTLNNLGAEVLLGAAQLDDGGAFTDYTDEATNPTDGSDLGSTDDVDLLPATPAVNDAFYIGHDDQFEHVSIDITTPGVGAYTGTWEYWNGSSYSALTVTDNTGSFKTGQLKTLTFAKPTDWVTNTVNSLGPHYYIRFRVTGTGITTQPKATKITIHHEFSVSLDSSVATQGDDYKPKYESDINQNIITVVQDILSPTTLVVRAENDGFHVINIGSTASPVDYTYDTDHAFWVGVLSQSKVLPNRITATNIAPGDPDTRHQGTVGDSASQAAHGTFDQIIIDSGITSDGDAVERATHALTREGRNLPQGELEVPMQVSQEVWDVVRVEDSRSGQTYDSRVSQVVRLYIPGEGTYLLRLGMGGSERVVDPPDSSFPVGDLGIGPMATGAAALPTQLERRGVEFVGVDPVARVPDIGPVGGGGFVVRDSEGVFDLITGMGGNAAGSPVGLHKKAMPTIPSRLWNTDQWGLYPTQSPQMFRRQVQPASGGFLSNTSRLLLQSFLVEEISPLRAVGSGLAVDFILSGNGSDKVAFHFKSSAIDHGMTSFAPTDSGGDIGVLGVAGGMGLHGHTESTVGVELAGRISVETTLHTDETPAAIVVEAGLKSGTSTVALANNANMVVFSNDNVNKLFMTGAGGLIPGSGAGHDLGDATDFWDDVYFGNVRAGTLFARTGTSIAISDDLIPDSNGLLDLGSGSFYYANVYGDVVTSALVAPKVSGTSDVGNSGNYWDNGWFENLQVTTILPRVSNQPLVFDLGSQPVVFDQGSVDTQIITYRSSDVAHGMIDFFADTSDYAVYAKVSGSTGGLTIRAGREVASGSPVLRLQGFGTDNDATKSTAAAGGYIQLVGAKASGTGVTDLTSNTNLVVVRNNATTRFILDADGNSHQDVGTAWTNFDSHNDPVLLRDFADAVSGDSIKAGFGQFLAYNKPQLEELGLVSFAGPTPFVNMSRLTMLHTGAIWQLHSRIEVLEEELKMLRGGPNG